MALAKVNICPQHLWLEKSLLGKGSLWSHDTKAGPQLFWHPNRERESQIPAAAGKMVAHNLIRNQGTSVKSISDFRDCVEGKKWFLVFERATGLITQLYKIKIEERSKKVLAGKFNWQAYG